MGDLVTLVQYHKNHAPNYVRILLLTPCNEKNNEQYQVKP
jgi:hypothetical protein